MKQINLLRQTLKTLCLLAWSATQFLSSIPDCSIESENDQSNQKWQLDSGITLSQAPITNARKISITVKKKFFQTISCYVGLVSFSLEEC